MRRINLSGFLKELNAQKHLNREEKVEKIFTFLLDYLNQGVKQNWEAKRHKTLMLLTMAEYEWKQAKKEAWQELKNERISY